MAHPEAIKLGLGDGQALETSVRGWVQVWDYYSEGEFKHHRCDTLGLVFVYPKSQQQHPKTQAVLG